MGRRQKLIDDTDWVEVKYINSYAAFIGYMSMAVRGLGFLVFTWTTVVLLGGFVPMLEKKDFWCLTVITLVQTRAFNGYLREKIWDIRYWYSGISHLAVDVAKLISGPCLKQFHVAVRLGFQVFVASVILFPLMAMHMFGLYITTGISLWRLIHHDYATKDGEANMKLGLHVLYFLALLQGALFCYRASCFSTGRRLVKVVEEEYGFKDKAVMKLVKRYLRDTRLGCAKDPSSAKGSNLFTFALDLMGSQSPHSYLSGLRVLDTIISGGPGPSLLKVSEKMGLRQRTVIRQTIMSASSSHILQKLLQSLDSTNPCDGEVRLRAARVVALLASDIRLEQFPRGIRCIATLFDTPSHGEARAGDHKDLMLQGLLILGQLDADEEYCRAILNTKGLLSTIAAPISSDVLHCIDHKVFSDIVTASLQVICQLVTTSGKSVSALRGYISENTDAMKTIKRIPRCKDCGVELCILAFKILTQLDVREGREDIIKMMLNIFTEPKSESIRELAGEALAELCFQAGSNDNIIFQVDGDVVGRLTKILLDVTEVDTCRKSAAEILEKLCAQHTNDEYRTKLEEAMLKVLPEVLNQILPAEDKKVDTPRGYSAPDADVEGQVRHNSKLCEHKEEQDKYRKLKPAFLSLCLTICNTFLNADQDLSPHFDPKKLKNMVMKNNEQTVDCLRIMKVTSKIVISMMGRKSSYVGSVKEDVDSLVKALSSASKLMFLLDGSTVFARRNDCDDPNNAVKTLGSLVKEAQEMARTYAAQVKAITD